MTLKRTIALVFIIVNLVMFALLIGPRVFGECGYFSPKEVPFHEGMTICPGQSAVFEMHIDLPEPKRDDGI